MNDENHFGYSFSQLKCLMKLMKALVSKVTKHEDGFFLKYLLFALEVSTTFSNINLKKRIFVKVISYDSLDRIFLKILLMVSLFE